jgi:hypothetical protein
MPLPNLTLRTLSPTVGTTKGSALSFAEMDTNLNNLATANITLTAGGVSSNLGFNNTLTIHAGNGTEVVNNSGNVSISATYSNVQVASYLTVNPPAGTYSNVQVASYLAGNITVGNIAGKTSGFTIGYLEMPQVAAGNVTLALADSGKHFYDTSTAPITVTIPNNVNVAFNTGTVVSLVNNSTGNLIIGRQDAVSLYLGGNATSAGRTITSYGVATLMKVDTNTWFVNGSGVV